MNRLHIAILRCIESLTVRLPPDTATFTTGNGIDLILLAVVTIIPPQGATDVATNVAVTLQVNKRLSPLSISPDARVLTSNSTGQQVPGTVSLSAELT